MRIFGLLALALSPGLALAQSTPTFDHQKVLESVTTRSDQMATRISSARERVLSLRAEIIQDNLTPTRLVLTHKNEMGQSFKIESISYTLNNVQIADRQKPTFDPLGQLQVFDGELRHGSHELKVVVVYMGTGVGAYPTLGGFRYEVRRTLKLEVPEGRLTEATVVGFPRTEPGLEARQRFDFKLLSASQPQAAKK